MAASNTELPPASRSRVRKAVLAGRARGEEPAASRSPTAQQKLSRDDEKEDQGRDGGRGLFQYVQGTIVLINLLVVLMYISNNYFVRIELLLLKRNYLCHGRSLETI